MPPSPSSSVEMAKQQVPISVNTQSSEEAQQHAPAPKTPRPVLSRSPTFETNEKQPATLSLMMSAARRRNTPQDDAESVHSDLPSTRAYSFRNLLARDGDEQSVDVVAPEGIHRFRQLFATRIIERHYTRHVRVKPAQLYLDAGKTKRAEWGRLTFASTGVTGKGAQTARSRTAASYMRVGHNSEAGRVARCIAKFWQVPRPSVLISVTGGARSLKISAWHRKTFCEGLLAAAKATDAIIFTGGTATGVMALVGDALAAPGGHNVPCIGFCVWNKVLGSALLAGNHGETEPRKYAAGGESANSGAALEPRHSHFVLVDKENGEWGDEVIMRDNVQQMLETWYKVPGVLLVLGGGPNTLATIVQAIITSATPVIIVEESGGAADAVAGFHHGWDAAEGLVAVPRRESGGKPSATRRFEMARFA